MGLQRTATSWRCLLALAWICPATLSASSADDRDHEDGALLRLWVGVGGAHSERQTSWGKLRFSGRASEVNFAVGGIVSPNLALHATLYGWTVNHPDAELGGVATAVHGDFDLTAVGGGVTYYLMPLNVYFSGTLGCGSLRLEHTATGSSTTGIGLVTDAAVGKEWWIARQWGLGGAVGFGYHNLPLEDSSVRWRGSSLTMRLSLTMN